MAGRVLRIGPGLRLRVIREAVVVGIGLVAQRVGLLFGLLERHPDRAAVEVGAGVEIDGGLALAGGLRGRESLARRSTTVEIARPSIAMTAAPMRAPASSNNVTVNGSPDPDDDRA